MHRTLFATILLLGPAAALAQVPTGDPAEGGKVAKTWCSNCHVIDNNPTSAGDTVPSFPAIANHTATTALSLQAFLQTPHGQMPNFQLSRQEIDDVVAYILTLRH
jgi:mono/diheme cytochrome c family protein